MLVLILVLTIHEFGHFIMMKIYKYKNVQIFFIPFIGAAVNGNELIQSGTQKSLVLLMGVHFLEL